MSYKTKKKLRKIRRKSYLANREKIIKKARQYALANREKTREYHRKYYLANKKRLRENSKKYKIANKEKVGKYHREYAKKWKVAHRKENLAQHKLRHAVKSGKIKKQPCEFCENKKSMAHHFDYDKPLSVIWVCQSCHQKIHRA